MELSLVTAENAPEGCLLSISAGSSRRQAPLQPNQKFGFSTSSTSAACVPGGSGLKVEVLTVQGTARISADEIAPRQDVGTLINNSYTSRMIEVPIEIPSLDPSGEGTALRLKMRLRHRNQEFSNDIREKTPRIANENDSSLKAEVNPDQPLNMVTVMQPAQNFAQLMDSKDTKPDPSAKSWKRHHAALEARSYLDEHNILFFIERMLRTLVMDRPEDPWSCITSLFPPGKRFVPAETQPPTKSKPMEQQLAEKPAAIMLKPADVQQFVPWKLRPSVGTWFCGLNSQGRPLFAATVQSSELVFRVGGSASIREIPSVSEEEINFLSNNAVAPIAPEAETVTRVEFSFEHLNYDVVMSSPDLHRNLMQQVREAIALEMNVPPEMLDLDIRRGSVIFTIRIQHGTAKSAQKGASALGSRGPQLLQAVHQKALMVPSILSAAEGPGLSGDLGLGKLSMVVEKRRPGPVVAAQQQVTSITNESEATSARTAAVATQVPGIFTSAKATAQVEGSINATSGVATAATTTTTATTMAAAAPEAMHASKADVPRQMGFALDSVSLPPPGISTAMITPSSTKPKPPSAEAAATEAADSATLTTLTHKCVQTQSRAVTPLQSVASETHAVSEPESNLAYADTDSQQPAQVGSTVEHPVKSTAQDTHHMLSSNMLYKAVAPPLSASDVKEESVTELTASITGELAAEEQLQPAGAPQTPRLPSRLEPAFAVVGSAVGLLADLSESTDSHAPIEYATAQPQASTWTIHANKPTGVAPTIAEPEASAFSGSVQPPHADPNDQLTMCTNGMLDDDATEVEVATQGQDDEATECAEGMIPQSGRMTAASVDVGRSADLEVLCAEEELSQHVVLQGVETVTESGVSPKKESEAQVTDLELPIEDSRSTTFPAKGPWQSEPLSPSRCAPGLPMGSPCSSQFSSEEESAFNDSRAPSAIEQDQAQTNVHSRSSKHLDHTSLAMSTCVADPIQAGNVLKQAAAKSSFDGTLLPAIAKTGSQLEFAPVCLVDFSFENLDYHKVMNNPPMCMALTSAIQEFMSLRLQVSTEMIDIALSHGSICVSAVVRLPSIESAIESCKAISSERDNFVRLLERCTLKRVPDILEATCEGPGLGICNLKSAIAEKLVPSMHRPQNLGTASTVVPETAQMTLEGASELRTGAMTDLESFFSQPRAESEARVVALTDGSTVFSAPMLSSCSADKPEGKQDKQPKGPAETNQSSGPHVEGFAFKMNTTVPFKEQERVILQSEIQHSLEAEVFETATSPTCGTSVADPIEDVELTINAPHLSSCLKVGTVTGDVVQCKEIAAGTQPKLDIQSQLLDAQVPQAELPATQVFSVDSRSNVELPATQATGIKLIQAKAYPVANDHDQVCQPEAGIKAPIKGMKRPTQTSSVGDSSMEPSALEKENSVSDAEWPPEAMSKHGVLVAHHSSAELSTAQQAVSEGSVCQLPAERSASSVQCDSNKDALKVVVCEALGAEQALAQTEAAVSESKLTGKDDCPAECTSAHGCSSAGSAAHWQLSATGSPKCIPQASELQPLRLPAQSLPASETSISLAPEAPPQPTDQSGPPPTLLREPEIGLDYGVLPGHSAVQLQGVVPLKPDPLLPESKPLKVPEPNLQASEESVKTLEAPLQQMSKSDPMLDSPQKTVEYAPDGVIPDRHSAVELSPAHLVASEGSVCQLPAEQSPTAEPCVSPKAVLKLPASVYNFAEETRLQAEAQVWRQDSILTDGHSAVECSSVHLLASEGSECQLPAEQSPTAEPCVSPKRTLKLPASVISSAEQAQPQAEAQVFASSMTRKKDTVLTDHHSAVELSPAHLLASEGSEYQLPAEQSPTAETCVSPKRALKLPASISSAEQAQPQAEAQVMASSMIRKQDSVLTDRHSAVELSPAHLLASEGSGCQLPAEQSPTADTCVSPNRALKLPASISCAEQAQPQAEVQVFASSMTRKQDSVLTDRHSAVELSPAHLLASEGSECQLPAEQALTAEPCVSPKRALKLPASVISFAEQAQPQAEAQVFASGITRKQDSVLTDRHSAVELSPAHLLASEGSEFQLPAEQALTAEPCVSPKRALKLPASVISFAEQAQAQAEAQVFASSLTREQDSMSADPTRAMGVSSEGSVVQLLAVEPKQEPLTAEPQILTHPAEATLQQLAQQKDTQPDSLMSLPWLLRCMPPGMSDQACMQQQPPPPSVGTWLARRPTPPTPRTAVSDTVQTPRDVMPKRIEVANHWDAVHEVTTGCAMEKSAPEEVQPMSSEVEQQQRCGSEAASGSAMPDASDGADMQELAMARAPEKCMRAAEEAQPMSIDIEQQHQLRGGGAASLKEAAQSFGTAMPDAIDSADLARALPQLARPAGKEVPPTTPEAKYKQYAVATEPDELVEDSALNLPSTEITFSLQNLNFDLVQADTADTLKREVQETVAKEINVQPAQVEISLARGSVLVKATVWHLSQDSINFASEKIESEDDQLSFIGKLESCALKVPKILEAAEEKMVGLGFGKFKTFFHPEVEVPAGVLHSVKQYMTNKTMNHNRPTKEDLTPEASEKKELPNAVVGKETRVTCHTRNSKAADLTPEPDMTIPRTNMISTSADPAPSTAAQETNQCTKANAPMTPAAEDLAPDAAENKAGAQSAPPVTTSICSKDANLLQAAPRTELATQLFMETQDTTSKLVKVDNDALTSAAQQNLSSAPAEMSPKRTFSPTIGSWLMPPSGFQEAATEVSSLVPEEHTQYHLETSRPLGGLAEASAESSGPSVLQHRGTLPTNPESMSLGTALPDAMEVYDVPHFTVLHAHRPSVGTWLTRRHPLKAEPALSEALLRWRHAVKAVINRSRKKNISRHHAKKLRSRIDLEKVRVICHEWRLVLLRSKQVQMQPSLSSVDTSLAIMPSPLAAQNHDDPEVLRQYAKDAWLSASSNGNLLAALEHIAMEVSPVNADMHGDVDVLREHAKDALLGARSDGNLQATLDSLSPLLTNEASSLDLLENLREQAQSAFLNASRDAMRFEAVLRPLREETAHSQVEHLRAQACSALIDASNTGSLLATLGPIANESSKNGSQAEFLRENAKDIFLASCCDGSLAAKLDNISPILNQEASGNTRIANLREQAQKAFLVATSSGRLVETLSSIAKTREKRGDESTEVPLLQQAKRALFKANRQGTLPNMLRDIASPGTPVRMGPDPGEECLRKEAKVALLRAKRRGMLAAHVRKVLKGEAASVKQAFAKELAVEDDAVKVMRQQLRIALFTAKADGSLAAKLQNATVSPAA